VNRIENCERIRPDHDGIPTTGPISILQNGIRYNSHYLGVDDPEDAKLAAFTWYSSGLRIVDISDPYFPKEVGYFIPPTSILVGRAPTRIGRIRSCASTGETSGSIR
jgi:hypothetical protein